jgi:hypothetical protein
MMKQTIPLDRLMRRLQNKIGHFAMIQPTAGRLLMVVALVLAASGARAQRSAGGLLSAPGQLLGGVVSPLNTSPLNALPLTGPASPLGVVNDLGVGRLDGDRDAPTLLDLRRQRLGLLVRDNRAALDVDDAGNPVRRGEVMLIDPSPADLATAEAAGFTRLRDDRELNLGFAVTVLAPPKGRNAAAALKMLRARDPSADVELNHVYEPAGGGLAVGGGSLAASAPAGASIGMVDGGVAAHPSLAGAAIEQRGFAAGGPAPTGHGTAVASLLVGSDGAFQGAARGRSLLVADVYGGSAASGSAEAIVDGLAWLAGRGVKVVTISLVGPPNRLLRRGVDALLAKGVLVVAAVGNDGPAAPPLYPASYPGVIAVTAVDARNHALLEAGRATHLDFAAPGADMAAALPGKGYAAVRGTSFAAPLVAARLAVAGGSGASALTAVAAEATPGKGAVGRGVVCQSCRVDPRNVGAKK